MLSFAFCSCISLSFQKPLCDFPQRSLSHPRLHVHRRFYAYPKNGMPNPNMAGVSSVPCSPKGADQDGHVIQVSASEWTSGLLRDVGRCSFLVEALSWGISWPLSTSWEEMEETGWDKAISEEGKTRTLDGDLNLGAPRCQYFHGKAGLCWILFAYSTEKHLTASNLPTPELSFTNGQHGSLDMSEALNQAAGLPLMPLNPQPQLVPAGHMTTPKVSRIKVDDPYTHFTLEDVEAHIVYHSQTV